jgi:aminopeptidase N
MTKTIDRLINYFKPDNYKIDYLFSNDLLTYNAKVKITGQLSNPANTIKLHVKNLTINTVIFNSQKLNFSLQEDDILQIELKETYSGSVVIEIDYNGDVSKSMHGIYLSSSQNNSLLVSTQFESHHAREAFPCIDEPEAKAVFDLSITAPSKLKAIANMPILTSHIVDNNTTTQFMSTPIMSTYLLAFVIGDIHNIEASTNDGVNVGVWATTDQPKESLQFALEVGVKTIEFLNGYFGVKYPLPKLDQIAIPDFSSGAMENWGLVTYREIALLVDPQKSSTSSKEMVALVIAHELAHQWFGNLVTMKWWDDLWLNESFATLMEYIIIDNLYPEWNVMLTFASHEALSAFRRDILSGVQAVACQVNHPDEISTLFDPSIVYAKGARLLWMVYNLVGEASFKQGLTNYFNKHAYGNTVGADLWQALSNASGLDVGSIMDTWINQPGVPCVTINKTIDNKINLQQDRITSEGLSGHSHWAIPLWPSQNQPSKILTDAQITLNNFRTISLFNTIGGHYICNYQSKDTRDYLRQQITNKSLPADSRLLVLNDALILSKCNVAPIHQMLDTISAYLNEDQESVWSVISLALSDVRMLIEGDEQAEQKLRQYVANLIKIKFEQLGWNPKNNETSNDRKLRAILSNLAIYTENTEAIEYALNLYNQVDINTMPNDTRTAVLTAVAKFGDVQAYDNLIKLYPNESVADIKLDIGAALSATRNLDQINKLISLLKDDDFVKLQDLDRFVAYLLRNSQSRPLMWQWLTDNWGWIETNFASDKSYDSYPRYAASAFSTEEWLKNYQDHFMPKINEPSLKRNITVGIQDIKSKIDWRNKVLPDLLNWITAQ